MRNFTEVSDVRKHSVGQDYFSDVNRSRKFPASFKETRNGMDDSLEYSLVLLASKTLLCS